MPTSETKLKSPYKEILRELNKGNAVLVEVVTRNYRAYLDRYRLITPDDCFFGYIDADAADLGFIRSCFVYAEPINAEEIMEAMQAYDQLKLRVVRWEVL